MRPMAATLLEIGAGEFMSEASTQLQALVHAVSDQGKGGELTLKVKVKPAGSRSGAVNVTYDVICKKPVGERPTQIMWPTPEGDLLASDPRQQKLDLRDVNEKPAAPLKTVATA